MKKCLVPVLALIFGLAFAGCATAPPVGVGPVSKPVASGGVKTLSAEPIFVEPGGRTVCVYFGDNSGHGADLKPAIVAKLQAKGLTLVDRPDQADYIVNARMTYLGYCKDYPDQPFMGRLLGTAAGVGAGAAIGRQTHQGTAWGAGLGLVGLLIGAAIDQANTPDLYYGSVSLQVKQRLTFLGDAPDNRPITNDHKTTVTTTDASGRTKTTATEQRDENISSPVQTNVSVAQSGQSNIKVTTQQKVADYEVHQTTLNGLTKVLHSDTNRSVDELSDYFANAIAGIF